MIHNIELRPRDLRSNTIDSLREVRNLLQKTQQRLMDDELNNSSLINELDNAINEINDSICSSTTSDEKIIRLVKSYLQKRANGDVQITIVKKPEHAQIYYSPLR